MKAIVCEKPFELEITERSRPLRQPGEVMVRIKRVGLCGTDYHIFKGQQPFLSYPRVMGHELAGEIVETDEGSPLKLGQLVTINPYLACGHCIACRKSKPNCCVAIKVLGVHTDGGMSEFICVPEPAIVPVDGLTPDQAAMVEFLAIGAHAVRRGAVADNDRVLVVGAGPIGIAVALFSRFSGADITLIDTDADRLAQAQSGIGVSHTAPVDANLAAYLSARTDGEGFDVVFDATGSNQAMEAGFAHVAHGGKYVLVSVVKGDITFSDPEFHKREMQLIASRNATSEDFRQVIDAIRRGDIPTQALHTQSFALLDIPAVIEDLIAKRGTVLKAIGHF